MIMPKGAALTQSDLLKIDVHSKLPDSVIFVYICILDSIKQYLLRRTRYKNKRRLKTMFEFISRRASI